MSQKNLKGKSESEEKAIEIESEKNRQAVNSAELELTNLRKVVKAHIENVLGSCNDYAKGIVNTMPKALLDVALNLDEVALSAMFGQKAINDSFCNVRKIADKDTRKAARQNDLKAREKSQVAYKSAKLELFTAFDKLIDKIKPSANKALGLMVEGIKAWPEDVDNKSIGFMNETVRQGDYVLTFTATTKFKPEKKD